MKTIALILLLVPSLVLATTHFQFSVASDFTTSPIDYPKLLLEVDAAVTQGISNLYEQDGVVHAVFASDLTTAEETALHGNTTDPCGGVIGAHAFVEIKTFVRRNTEASTTQTTWKQRGQLDVYPSTGTIEVMATAEITLSSALNYVEVALVNETDDVTLASEEYRPAVAGKWRSFTSFERVTMAGTPKTFSIKYRVAPGSEGSPSASIRNVRISYREVSP